MKGKQQFGGSEICVWLSATAVAFALLLICGLCALVLVNGTMSFWPSDVQRFELNDGTVALGQVTEREELPAVDNTAGRSRFQLRRGSRDVYGQDFVWINSVDVARVDQPAEVMIVERLEWGPFVGFVKSIREGENMIATNFENIDTLLPKFIAQSQSIRDQVHHLTKGPMQRIAREQSTLTQVISAGRQSPESLERLGQLEVQVRELEGAIERLRASDKKELVIQAANGTEQVVPIANIVRSYAPNRMSTMQKVGLYLQKVGEFLWSDPRESNTEGGVFPAIFGTVLVVILMSLVATPFGVIGAIYLREYATQGKLTSLIRIAVNNLAGVPSIVFGVFGMGFFVYFLGGNIDRLFFADALPNPTFGSGGILWASLTLSLLTVPTVIVATEEGLASIPKHLREGAYALGATKFETLWRVILPSLMPSILTGMILAVARGAGEVAPLMITGVVKLAPSLPIDGEWPFVHLNRKFMHLGFHIFDVGFQSPNVEAARPMVFSTALLLLIIVVLLNFGAMKLRSRLRSKFSGHAV
ncbi:MAG: phosphate ABC transporter permease PstA [Bdellovibrionota bacterium]